MAEVLQGAPAGRISLAAGGKLPSAGWPESEPVRLQSWEERRHRERTSMESRKSTWRAVRFLSISHGQKQEGRVFSFRGHRSNCFLVSSPFDKWGGVRVGDKAF